MKPLKIYLLQNSGALVNLYKLNREAHRIAWSQFLSWKQQKRASTVRIPGVDFPIVILYLNKPNFGTFTEKINAKQNSTGHIVKIDGFAFHALITTRGHLKSITEPKVEPKMEVVK